MSDPILERVARYYGGKLAEHGPTAAGVDWRDEQSQSLRFAQLLQVADRSATLDVLDYGSGYGALVTYLERDGRPFSYLGYDVAPEMVEAAQRAHGGDARIRFITDPADLERRDFVVASGVLNVRLDVPDEAWRAHVSATLDELHELSERGFAFNALTSYSEPSKMRGDLFYADPHELFDICKRRYSRHVALLHDYGLWEFTMLVRKDV